MAFTCTLVFKTSCRQLFSRLSNVIYFVHHFGLVRNILRQFGCISCVRSVDAADDDDDRAGVRAFTSKTPFRGQSLGPMK